MYFIESSTIYNDNNNSKDHMSIWSYFLVIFQGLVSRLNDDNVFNVTHSVIRGLK